MSLTNIRYFEITMRTSSILFYVSLNVMFPQTLPLNVSMS